MSTRRIWLTRANGLSLLRMLIAPALALAVTDGAFCNDRDAYFLWDPLHPTKKVHALFAEFALEKLP